MRRRPSPCCLPLVDVVEQLLEKTLQPQTPESPVAEVLGTLAGPQKQSRIYVMLYDISLYYILLYYIKLFSIILHHIMLYYMILYHCILCYVMLHYIVLYYILLYYLILYYIMLYCIVSSWRSGRKLRNGLRIAGSSPGPRSQGF